MWRCWGENYQYQDVVHGSGIPVWMMRLRMGWGRIQVVRFQLRWAWKWGTVPDATTGGLEL